MSEFGKIKRFIRREKIYTANQGSKFLFSGAFSMKGHFMPRHGGMVRNSEWEKLGKKGQEEVGGRPTRLIQALYWALAGSLHSSPARDAMQMRGLGRRKDRLLIQIHTLDNGCSGIYSLLDWF